MIFPGGILMKFTEREIAGLELPPDKPEVIVFHDQIGGFGLRLRAGGSRTWVYQYKIGAKHRRITFGAYPAMRAPEAREQAEKLHAKVRLGQDPAGEKADAQSRADETFEACMKQYLIRQRGKVRASTLKEIERHLLKNLAPLHGQRIDKIDRRGIALQLARLTSEGGPVQANRTRASLSGFLNWAAREGLVQGNEAAFTNKNAERPRDRVLEPTELVEIWRAVPDRDFGAIIQLLILTGQREREIADLRWSEVDLDRDLISLPPARTKNRRGHTIPLSSAARAILEAQPKRDGRDLVFGSGPGGFSGWSKSKNALDQAILAARKTSDKKAKPIPAWIIHDLRRAASTHMADKLNIQPHVIEAVLGHVSGHKAGVAGRYNLACYEAEKAAALTRWGDYVLALVEGRESNVATFKRA
jgi:integrase